MRRSLIIFAFVALAGCAAKTAQKPAGEPSSRPCVVKGWVSVKPDLENAGVWRGRLVVAYLSPSEQKQIHDGTATLDLMIDVLGRFHAMGDVDLSQPGARAAYSLEVPPGDVVVTAMLDTQSQFIRALFEGNVEGNLLGEAVAPVHVERGALASSDVVLTTVQHEGERPERCQGERLELVVIEAPEVRGRVGNSPSRRFCVYLPASYSSAPSRRYSAVFFLPGYGSDDVARFGRAHAGKLADQLTAETGHEVILVGVDSSSATGSTYFVDSPRTGSFETFFVRRAVPELEKRFRMLGKGTARALVGQSTGGFNAVSLAVRHPDVFSVVVASSPDALDLPSWWLAGDGKHAVPRLHQWMRVEDEVGGPGQMVSYASDWSYDDTARGFGWPFDLRTGLVDPETFARWKQHSPAAMLENPATVERVRDRLSGRIMLTAARDDEAGLFVPTEKFSNQLRTLQIEHAFVEQVGGHFLSEERLVAQLRWVLDVIDPASEARAQ